MVIFILRDLSDFFFFILPLGGHLARIGLCR